MNLFTHFPIALAGFVQVAVLIAFFVLSQFKKAEIKPVFPPGVYFSVLILGAIGLAWVLNSNMQLFCTPVNWTYALFIPFLAYLGVQEWVHKYIGDFFHFLLLGIGIFFSGFVILFGGWEYLVFCGFCLLIAIPLYLASYFLNRKYDTRFFDALNLFAYTIYLPYILLLWTLESVHQSSAKGRAGLSILPSIAFYVGVAFTLKLAMITDKIDAATSEEEQIAVTQELAQDQVDGYLTELVLGAHWKYHTKLCMYDGYRPPYLDPVLAFAQPVLYNGEQFQPGIPLEDRKELYSQTFPQNETTLACTCANF